MWICLNNAFLSVVKESKDKSILSVRARKKQHLVNVFPNKEIIQLKNRDYAYRVYATKQEVANLLMKQVMNIEYTNFKNSVKEKDLYSCYTDVWGVMYDLQANEKYATY